MLKQKSFYFVQYDQLERDICGLLNIPEFNIPYLCEISNDEARIAIDVTRKDNGLGDDFENGCSIRNVIAHLVRHKNYPEGDYLVNVSW